MRCDSGEGNLYFNSNNKKPQQPNLSACQTFSSKTHLFLYDLPTQSPFEAFFSVVFVFIISFIGATEECPAETKRGGAEVFADVEEGKQETFLGAREGWQNQRLEGLDVAGPVSHAT